MSRKSIPKLYDLGLNFAALSRRDKTKSQLNLQQNQFLARAVIRLLSKLQPNNQPINSYLELLHQALGECTDIATILDSSQSSSLTNSKLLINELRDNIVEEIRILKKASQLVEPVRIQLIAA